MLNGLVESGEIKARSKWKQVYSTFANDNRYLDMLGNPGSNPIELFWDIVDALDQKLDAKIAIAEAAIKRQNEALEAKMKEDSDSAQAEGAQKPFELGPDTTTQEFVSIVKADGDESVKTLTDEDLLEIYHSVWVLSCPTTNHRTHVYSTLHSFTTSPSKNKPMRSVERSGSSATCKTISVMRSRRSRSCTMQVCRTMR